MEDRENMKAVMTIRLPEMLDEAVKQAAKRHNLDRPVFVRAALSRAVHIGLFAMPPTEDEAMGNCKENDG